LARKHFNPPRKRRTREHVLADLSANHVERFVLQCGFAVDRVRQDYGLDLAVFTFDDQGFLESGVLWMQLKATDHARTTPDGKTVIVRLDRRDVLAWIAELYPVILVLYDAATERAYWLWMQGYSADTRAFARPRGITLTIRIPTANIIGKNTVRELAQRKADLFASPGEPS
jgi:Domain of unknown function (DUF4365)